MKKIYFFILLGYMSLFLGSCVDDETFTVSPSSMLAFSSDTITFDTLFSNVPTATRTFWVYNRNEKGIRCRMIQLAEGDKSGYRVNVDGTYLGPDIRYQYNDLEIRGRDSVRVYVELTAPKANQLLPKLLTDHLNFTLESGVVQNVQLKGYVWDAKVLKNCHIKKDTTIGYSGVPIIVDQNLVVDSSATLMIEAGNTLYFNTGAALEVYGTLKSQGTVQQPVVLRGSRIDKMFTNVPYDRIPGQWQGIILRTSSVNNVLEYTDIHSTQDGIKVDSTDVDKSKLTLDGCAVYNCQGYGLLAENASITMTNTVVANTLMDCVKLNGGHINMNHCTLAQFYPFDARRGYAFCFEPGKELVLNVNNSLITGYADDVLCYGKDDSLASLQYRFSNSVIRTPQPIDALSGHFVDVTYEDLNDTTGSGFKHFINIDTDNFIYNFRLRKESLAIGKASATTSLPQDKDGNMRDGQPDAGAFEYNIKE